MESLKESESAVCSVRDTNSDSKSLTALNRRVYDQLFLTPANDPWLGLVNENVYTGISKTL